VPRRRSIGVSTLKTHLNRTAEHRAEDRRKTDHYPRPYNGTNQNDWSHQPILGAFLSKFQDGIGDNDEVRRR